MGPIMRRLLRYPQQSRGPEGAIRPNSSPPAARVCQLTICLLGLALAPTPAKANGVLLLRPQIVLPAAVLLGAGSLCVTFTYDANGNRTAQTVVAIGAGAVTWGSGAFGCFVWHQ
jgi:hypothetical protein